MSDDKTATIATAPSVTGVGRYAHLLHALHFSDELVFYQKGYKSDPTGYDRVVSPSFGGYALNALLSAVHPNNWGRDIQKYKWAHITTPDYFHLVQYNKNVFGTVHDLFTMESDVTKKAYSYAYRRFIKLNFKYASLLKGIVAISEVTKDALVNLVPDCNVTVVRNWELDIFKSRDKGNARRELQLPANQKLILSVGSTEPRKNLSMLANLIRALPDDYSLLRIGGLDDNLTELPPKRIIHVNEINDQRYPLYFNAADLYVAPSLAEGFNRPIIQALKSELPVLASDIKIHEEILQDRAYLLDLSEPESWIERSQLFAEEGLSVNRLRKIQALSRYYSEERARKEMGEFYKTFVEV